MHFHKIGNQQQQAIWRQAAALTRRREQLIRLEVAEEALKVQFLFETYCNLKPLKFCNIAINAKDRSVAWRKAVGYGYGKGEEVKIPRVVVEVEVPSSFSKSVKVQLAGSHREICSRLRHLPKTRTKRPRLISQRQE